METDCVDFVKSCHDCQTHANLNHVPPRKLYSMIYPWPFLVWGIDVIERIAPKALNGHEYILVVIDYFTKWVEATSYSVLKAKHVAQFIKNNIICWYGVPQEIISNNGSHFVGEVQGIMELYNIEHHKSSPYRPQTNEAIEVANKNIKNILAKMMDTRTGPKNFHFLYRVIEFISVHHLGQPLTLWSMEVRRFFPLR